MKRLLSALWTRFLRILRFDPLPLLSARRRPRLCLEALEDRLALTGAEVSVTGGSWAYESSMPAAFTITRTGPTTADLTVNYTLVGSTASNGTDFALLSGSVVIPTGFSSASIDVTPVDDSAYEGDETVVLTLDSGAGYEVASPDSATIPIIDNDSAPPPQVSVTATDGDASEVGPDPGQFTLTWLGDTSGWRYVYFSLMGTATQGADYSADPQSGSASFAPGVSVRTVTIVPTPDSLVEGDESLDLFLTSGFGYDIAGAGSATVTIHDSPAPPPATVSVTSGGWAYEVGLPDLFTVTRTGPTTSALTVYYTVGGTAGNGTDYTMLMGSVEVPAGASSATFHVLPIDDSLYEGDETVVLTLDSSAGYTVGPPSSATITIVDNDQAPVAEVSVTGGGWAYESGSMPSAFTITRTGPTTADLTVNYTLVGSTASNGTDFALLTGSVVIPVGFSSAVVDVTPVDDGDYEGGETVVLTLGSGAGYEVASPDSATIPIIDNDQAPPQVSVTATDGDASEVGPDPGQFTLTWLGDTSGWRYVYFSLMGTAMQGADFYADPMPGSATFAPGQSVATVTIVPQPDSLVEGDESLDLFLTSGFGYDIAGTGNATVTIHDAPAVLPVVTVVASDAHAYEQGPDSATFVFHRTGDLSQMLTVLVDVSGTATAGVDYWGLLSWAAMVVQVQSGVNIVYFAPGQATVALSLDPMQDESSEPDETIHLTLLPDPSGGSSTYTIGMPGAATALIHDDLLPPPNQPPVNLVPGPQTTAEDTPLVFTNAGNNQVSVSDPDAGANPVQVTLSVGHGVLTLADVADLTFLAGNDGTAAMTFSGPLSAINGALLGLTYWPDLDFHGTDTLTITTDDLGGSGTGGPQSDTDAVALTVTPVNDAPLLWLPSTQHTPANTALIFSFASDTAIEIDDVDAGSGQVEVFLEVSHGVLTLGGMAGLTFTAGAKGCATTRRSASPVPRRWC